MARLHLTEPKQYKCWQKTAPRRVKKHIAQIRASEVFRRPDVAARVEYLRKEQAAAIPLPPAMRKEIILPKSPEETLALAKRKARKALENAEKSADIIKAVEACRMLGIFDEGKPEENFTAPLEVIRSFGAMTGEQIAAQLGGLPFMLDQFLSICKVSWQELREVLNSIYPEELNAKGN